MIKLILENIKLLFTIIRDNKVLFFLILPLTGVTISQYDKPLTVPVQPQKVINTAIIKKIDCGSECKKVMFDIAKQLIHKYDHDHNQNEH